MILIFITLLSATSVCGQNKAHTFSGDYDQVSFDSFVESLEESSGLIFYYHPKGTSGVTITAMGEELSLAEVLEQNLKPQGLSWYIDGGSNVFILRNSIIRMEDVIALTVPVGNRVSRPETKG